MAKEPETCGMGASGLRMRRRIHSKGGALGKKPVDDVLGQGFDQLVARVLDRFLDEVVNQGIGYGFFDIVAVACGFEVACRIRRR